MDLQSLPWYGQFAVFLVVGGILFGIFYMVYYSDGENQITSFTNQIDELDREIKRAEKKQMQLSQIQAEKVQKEKVLAKLKEILPEENEISQIIRKIQSIISGARLKIQNWKTQAKRRQEIYVEHPYGITVDGNYHNLGMFFDQLAKLKKIFTVNNLNIRPIPRMTSTFTIKASFTASTYTYQERKKKQRGGKGGRARR